MSHPLLVPTPREGLYAYFGSWKGPKESSKRERQRQVDTKAEADEGARNCLGLNLRDNAYGC